MPGVEAMIREAEKSLGIVGRPNSITRPYSARNGSYFANAPWCDMSITEWARRSGNFNVVNFGTDYAYTVWHAQRFQKAGRWTTDTRGIRRGDIVFFDWGGSNSVGAIDHVGIVTGVKGSAVYTIEGNTSDRCARRVRYAATIVGYGRPDYAGGDGSVSGGASVRPVLSQQKAVNGLGRTPALVEDGEWGPKTEAGVKWLQAKVGVTADGQWGPKTEAAYKAHIAEDVMKHQRYTKTKKQALPPGEWVSVEFQQYNGGSAGSYYSLAPDDCLYDVTVGLRISGLAKGDEYQVRLAEYESATPNWKNARNRAISEHFQGDGDAYAVHTGKGHAGKKRRVRVLVKQWTSSAAHLEWAEADVLYQPN